ncbi:MAG: DUF6198 family protein [Bifidobacterium psychraerophilum]|uniref:YczE/YyaS/YitT family protein n=1 Tax=Bifidobacterium psychraerophilum TaxID=218140 RepID=UPI0039E95412
MNTGHASHCGRRSVLFAAGINVLAIGTALFACCGLGVSALVAVPEVLSLLLPVTLGQMTTVFFIILVIIELCLLRSFRWRVIAQMGVALVFGWIVDFYGLTIGFDRLPVKLLWQQLLVTILAVIFTSLGVFMMVRADLVLNPPDGAVHVIAQKVGMAFGTTKFLFDLLMIVVAIALSLLFLRHIAAIGLGTALAVLLVGELISVWEKLFGPRRPASEAS